MILFINVFVTNQRASNGGLNRYDRLDIFKYCLSSFSSIDRIDEIIIYCELSPDYKHREPELRDYIDVIFNNKNIQFFNYSLTNQLEWQKAIFNSTILTTSKPILYSGNDDHIFIDYNLNVLYEGIELLKLESESQINTIHITSWTEGVSTIYNLNEFSLVGSYWKSPLLYPDAIQIVNKTFFQHFFFNLDLRGDFVRRTDWILENWYPFLGGYKYESKTDHPKVQTFLPLRELVRHFDAYFHISVPLSYCPLLKIPDGFFNNNIKINYCSQNKSEFFNLNPMSPCYFTENESGCDDKKMIEDLPIFWKNKITDVIDNSSVFNREEIVNARNLAFKKIMTAPHHRIYQIPHGTTIVPAATAVNSKSIGDGDLNLEEQYLKIGSRHE